MTGPDAFFDDLERALPFGDVERGEIVEELREHVAASVDDLLRDGRSRAEAEALAIGRLGPPVALARSLSSARRTPRRLLAAAGAGTWTLLTTAVWGWVVGILLAVVAFIAVTVVASLVGQRTALASGGGFDVVSFLGLAVATFIAASAVVPTVAERAGYRAVAVRRVLAVVGAAAIGFVGIVVWHGQLDGVGVCALLSLPGWWVLGTGRPRVRRGAYRTFLRLAAVAAAITIVTLLGERAVRDSTTDWQHAAVAGGDLSLDRIGAETPAAVSAAISGWGAVTGGSDAAVLSAFLSVDVVDRSAFVGWRDLRVEAWRALDPDGFSPTPVDPGARAPFAVGAASWSPPGTSADGSLHWGPVSSSPNAATLTGAVVLSRTPNVTAAWVAITGIDPDGRRTRVSAPTFYGTGFQGSAIEWIGAWLSGGSASSPSDGTTSDAPPS